MSSSVLIDGPRLAPVSGRRPQSLVILLHGYGSNGEDLIGLASHWRHTLLDTFFVAPDAPEPCPDAPGGFQWWPVWTTERTVGVRAAAAPLNAFIDAELSRHGLDETKLVLVGFSQGAMLALHVAPRRKQQVAGVVAYSGMLISADAEELITRPPILLVHGDADPMVPVAGLHHAQASLVGAGFDVKTSVRPGLGHSIDMTGLDLGGAFLSEVIG